MLEGTDLILVQRTEGSQAGTYCIDVESLEQGLQLLWQYGGFSSPDSDSGFYEPAEVDDASEGVVNDFDEALSDENLDLNIENTFLPAAFFEDASESGCIIEPVVEECGISGGVFA